MNNVNKYQQNVQVNLLENERETNQINQINNKIRSKPQSAQLINSTTGTGAVTGNANLEANCLLALSNNLKTNNHRSRNTGQTVYNQRSVIPGGPMGVTGGLENMKEDNMLNKENRENRENKENNENNENKENIKDNNNNNNLGEVSNSVSNPNNSNNSNNPNNKKVSTHKDKDKYKENQMMNSMGNPVISVGVGGISNKVNKPAYVISSNFKGNPNNNNNNTNNTNNTNNPANSTQSLAHGQNSNKNSSSHTNSNSNKLLKDEKRLKISDNFNLYSSYAGPSTGGSKPASKNQNQSGNGNGKNFFKKSNPVVLVDKSSKNK